MTSVQKLAKRLKEEHGTIIDIDSFDRVYAGHWQRAQGAWSWCAKLPDSTYPIGSQFSVRELLKYEKWEVYVNQFGDTEVDPVFPSKP